MADWLAFSFRFNEALPLVPFINWRFPERGVPCILALADGLPAATENKDKWIFWRYNFFFPKSVFLYLKNYKITTRFRLYRSRWLWWRCHIRCWAWLLLLWIIIRYRCRCRFRHRSSSCCFKFIVTINIASYE